MRAPTSRRERVLVETERHQILGTLLIPERIGNRRLSDHLNAGAREFLSLTEVSLRPVRHDGRLGPATKRGFVTVARRHICLVTPID